MRMKFSANRPAPPTAKPDPPTPRATAAVTTTAATVSLASESIRSSPRALTLVFRR